MMGYCVVGHLHRQYVDYLGYSFDFTSSHMVLVIKLWGIAWNLYDGDLIKRGVKSRATEKCKAFAIQETPGVLEFLGFTFCFSNVLAGPAYEFNTYKAACDGSLLYDKNGKPKGKIPSTFLPTIKPFITSIVCMGAYVVGSGKFPVLDPTTPQKAMPVFIRPGSGVSIHDGVSFFERYSYQWVALFFQRFKYYFAWKNAEGANNIWYAGFEGFDENKNVIGWDNANNMDILEFETATCIKDASGAWNKKTSNWLTRYVYMRTGGSLVATYATSAFWHGFYPGYYFFFLSMPLLTACERIGRQKISPRLSSGASKWTLYGLLTMVVTTFFINYFVQPFVVLSYEWSVAVYKDNYFFGHLGCLLFYFLCAYVVPSPPKTEKKTQ